MRRLSFLLCLIFFVSLLCGQSGLVVNEVSQGRSANRDWIELVVISDDCSPVDLRHWIIDDNNGIFTDCPGPDNGALANTGINHGHIRFTDDDLWAAVPSGTIILLYNWDPSSTNNQADIGGLQDDYTDEDCDFLRVMPVNASNLFIEQNDSFPRPPSVSSCSSGSFQCPNGGDGDPSYASGDYVPLVDNAFHSMPAGKIGFSVTADACQVRTPDQEYFHGFCWGTPSPAMDCTDMIDFNGGPDSLYITPIGQQGVTYMFLNFEDDDFRNVANFASRNTGLFATPGAANNCANAEWIASYRAPTVPEQVDTAFCTGGRSLAIQCLGDTLEFFDFLDSAVFCSGPEVGWTVVGGAANIELIANSADSFTIALIDTGMTSIQLTLSLAHDSLYSQAGCTDPGSASEIVIDYNIRILDASSDSLDLNRITECGDTQDSADFHLDLIAQDIKGGADTLFFYRMDGTEISQLPYRTSGDTIRVRYQISDCISPQLPLVLEVLPINRDTIAGRYCPGESLRIGNTTFDEQTPAGEIVVSSNTAEGCDTLYTVDMRFDLFPGVRSLDTALCVGDSLLVGESVYSEENLTGVDTLFAQAANGCDSIVTTTVTIVQAGRDTIAEPLCAGDSVLYGGVLFDENHLFEEIALPSQGANGCDSFLVVDLELVEPMVLSITDSICAGDSLLINSTWYHEGNLSGQDTLFGAAQTGCDSIVDIDLTLLQPGSRSIDTLLCTGDFLEINGTRYDASRPAGQEVFSSLSANGCDSIVDIQIQYHPEARNIIEDELCANDTLVINGQAYYAGRSVGRDTLFSASSTGCDSILDINLNILDVAEAEINSFICDGDSILINQTWYHAGNLEGTEVFIGAAANGCDSILRVDLTLRFPQFLEVNGEICPDDTLSYGGELFHQGNLQGTILLESAAMNGCDSIITVDLVPLPYGQTVIDDTLPLEDTLVIAGEVFDRDRPQAELRLEGAAQNGCDSLITVSLNFIDLPITVAHFSPDCAGEKGSLFLDQIGLGHYPIDITLAPLGSVYRIESMSDLPLEIYDLEPDLYSLSVQDAEGFKNRYDFEIRAPEIFDISGADQVEVFFGEDYTFELRTDAILDSIWWRPSDSLSCIDCLNPTIRPRQDQLYTVIGVDVNGCQYEHQILIEVLVDDRIYMPNVFSPNGDGVNDVLMPQTSDRIESIKLFQVYDRWGSLVYEGKSSSDNHMQGWPGNYKGEAAQSGVYIYVVEAALADGSVHRVSGDVTLIR